MVRKEKETVNQPMEPKRSGVDVYQTSLSYDADLVDEIADLVDEGQVVPLRFVLYYSRTADGKWRREAGSYAVGPRKGEEDVPARRLIFEHGVPALRGWATLMPGLRMAIEKVEASLPD